MRHETHHLLLLFAAAAHAQNRCLVTDTPRECFNRYAPVDAIRALVAAQNTGSLERSAVKDFLSTAVSELKAAAVGDEPNDVTLGFNVPVRLLGNEHQVRVEGFIAEKKT